MKAMRAIVIWLITAVAIAVAVLVVPGIDLLGEQMEALPSLIILAAILALLNSFIKPVLKIISLPITCLTLGLFSLVINTLVLYLAVWIGNGLFDIGFEISSFWSALGASIVISIVVAILNAITGVNAKPVKH